MTKRGRVTAARILEEGPAHGRPRQKCRALGREGGPGHGPSPRDPPPKRRAVGSTWRLRAHTPETASPFPWGGGGPCRKWSRRSASPPIPSPWQGIRLRVGRGCMHVVRTRGQGGETKRRAAAMMLSRTGWDETPFPVACQTVEGRRVPWGCAAGAPYWGTASPPPPPICAAGAGIRKRVWVWGLGYMHRWCWCGSSASVLQKWFEVRTKIPTKFVRNWCELRTKFVRNSSPKCLTVRYCECGCYEFRTKFVRISHEVQTICMNVCHFCVCVDVHGPRGCCLCGRVCMVCACLGDMCMHWWFLGSWVVLLNHVGRDFCAVCSL